MNVKVVGVVLGIIFSASLVFQIFQLYKFINQGPRFTAQDGQELCARVRFLESVSYGFLNTGKPFAECTYYKLR